MTTDLPFFLGTSYSDIATPKTTGEAISTS